MFVCDAGVWGGDRSIESVTTAAAAHGTPLESYSTERSGDMVESGTIAAAAHFSP